MIGENARSLILEKWPEDAIHVSLSMSGSSAQMPNKSTLLPSSDFINPLSRTHFVHVESAVRTHIVSSSTGSTPHGRVRISAELDRGCF